MDPEKKQHSTEHREHLERRFDDHDSGSTVQGDDSPRETLGHGNVPDVDTKYASELSVSKLKGKWLTWMVTVVAGTGFMLLGYDQGFVSGLLTLPSFEEQFPMTAGGFQGSRSATLQSFLVAIYEIGCMIGALSNIWIGDRLGRLKTIMVAGVIMIVGCALQAGSINYAMILVSRVISGFGNGMLTSTIPAYQSECAKPARRGQLVLFEGSLITFGIAVAYWINVGFFFVDQAGGPHRSAAWRFPTAFQLIFFMMFCIWWFKAPESPRWLAKKGYYPECLATLAALENKPVDDPEVLRTFRGICDVLAAEDQGGFKISELLTHGKSQNFRRTAIGCLSQVFQQITGINLITYYLTSVLSSMGLSPLMSRVISGVNGTCYFLTSLIAVAIIEKFGRRPLMLSMALAQGITMMILAGLYNLVEQENKVAQGFSVLMLFLFNTWFSIGWLGMTWLYPSEVVGLRIRAQANALSTASNWVFNFFVVMVTGPMFANIKYGTYIFFGALNLFIVLPGTYLLFPETKKYSLEDLDIIFAMGHEQKRNPVWISTEGNIPEAGSLEANKILGREAGRPDMSKEHGLSHQHSRSGGAGMGRTISRRLSSGSRRLSSSQAV